MDISDCQRTNPTLCASKWMNLEQLERPGKKSRGQRHKEGREPGGLVHSLVMKRIMIKVSQGLIMSQINVVSSVVQSNTRKTVSSSTKTTSISLSSRQKVFALNVDRICYPMILLCLRIFLGITITNILPN